MNQRTGFLDFLHKEHRAIWTALKIAEQENLVHMDTETDAISGTNRLLLTYPGLHDVLSLLTNEWAENQNNTEAFHELITYQEVVS
ncbi:hypothetical protein ACFL3F_01835 [Planctomycetota bacterium]